MDIKFSIKEIKKNGYFFFKNALLITGCFLVVIIFLMVLIGWSNLKNQRDKSIENVDKSIQNIHNLSEEFFSTYYVQLGKIIISGNATMFSKKSLNEEFLFKKLTELKETLNIGTSLVNSVNSIYLYSPYRDYIITTNGTTSVASFEDLGWLDDENFQGSDGKVCVFSRFMPSYGNVLSFTYTINTGERNITGVINIDLAQHLSLYKNEGTDKIIFFNNKTNKIEYQSDTELSSAELMSLLNKSPNKSDVIKNKGKYYAVSSMKSQYGDFSYGIVEELPDYKRTNFFTYLILIFCVLAVLVFSAFMVLLYTDSSYRPIREIAEILEQPTSEISKNYLENDETTRKIAQSILSMVTTNDTLKSELQKKTKIFEYAQLKALQWQMNPHFIFNTLNMLYMMSLDKKADKQLFSSAILSLSKLMRYYLKTETMTVTLSEEKSMTEEYLKIMRARNGDTFKVAWDIDGSLYGKQVTKMCIQPVLENCFKYGISTAEGTPEITISAHPAGKYFVISVCDNCSEITQKTTDELNALFKKDTDIPETHIGLNNINARIVLMYGRPCGITVQNSLPKKGLTVNMKFPI